MVADVKKFNECEIKQLKIAIELIKSVNSV